MKLTTRESAELKKLEAVIKKHKDAWIQVGEALTKIRDTKLYREKYETFEAYCEEVWGWSKKHAYHLIASAPIGKSNPLLTSANAAKALSKVPVPQRAAVVAQAASSGAVTAKSIANAAQKPPVTTAAVQKDGTGFPIPPESLDLWESAETVVEILTYLAAIRSRIDDAQDSGNKLFAEVNFKSVCASIDQAKADLETARPYAVCVTCNGTEPEGCLDCKGRGFVSKFYWKNCVPDEAKKLRGAVEI
jgi:hypothetical protein